MARGERNLQGRHESRGSVASPEIEPKNRLLILTGQWKLSTIWRAEGRGIGSRCKIGL